MADIPSDLIKISDLELDEDLPVCEATMFRMGASLNLRVKEKARLKKFITSSNFNVPDDMLFPWVFVLGVGGGGGGASGGGNGQALTSIGEGGGGGGGGNGAAAEMVFVPVTPGGVVTVTIGNGGGGGLRTTPQIDGKDGLAGGSSFFGGFRFAGGAGGNRGIKHDGSIPGAAKSVSPVLDPRLNALQITIVGGPGGGVIPQSAGTSGAESHFAVGGVGGTTSATSGHAAGGGGGGAGLGPGGAGGPGAPTGFDTSGGIGGSAAAASSYGAGGGGGAGMPGSTVVRLSGAGGDGAGGAVWVLYYSETDAT